MSIEILGNNSYEDVPLVDMAAGTWAEGVNRCDPLFRDLAIAGLSALCHGIRQSSESQVLDTLEFGELFDESGMFIGDALSRIINDGRYPSPPNVGHYVAGIHVTRAALTASRLFGGKLRVINDDYVGQTGVNYVSRRVEFPVSDARGAGRTMNTYPVRNIQARVFTQQGPNHHDSSHTEIDFAAGLYGSGSLPWSMTTSLSGGIDSRRQSARARVVSGARQGDFVRGSGHASFDELSCYAQVVDENL